MEETATVAGGCFWCTEAIFNDLIGVRRVESGYTGGDIPNPSYEAVCSGETGHAEAIRIWFDSRAITYDDLLDVFFATHDPTQLNRQGSDVGSQYRSAIFPANDDQRKAAVAAIERAGCGWGQPVVTTIEPLGEWYPAEAYHQQYFARVGSQNPYCVAVIDPKLRKFRKSYLGRLKPAS